MVDSASDIEERTPVAEEEPTVCDGGIEVMWIEVEEVEEKSRDSVDVDPGHVGVPLIVVQY